MKNYTHELQSVSDMLGKNQTPAIIVNIKMSCSADIIHYNINIVRFRLDGSNPYKKHDFRYILPGIATNPNYY